MKALRLEGRGIISADIENTLEALQAAVGGYIEAVTLVPGRAVMIVNEEGLLRGMAPNPAASMIAKTKIVGPAIVVGVDGEEFTDIPEDVERCIKALFA
jgi:hypothetical protein